MAKALELTGQRFGRLVVIERVITDKPKSRWECRCDCGKSTTVYGVDLRSGNTQSCGCGSSRYKPTRLTHGQSSGKNITPEYRAWAAMKDRCYNIKNPKYA